jgi:hypothetical protein
VKVNILASALGDLDRGRRFYARQGKSVGDICIVFRVFECRQEPEKPPKL